MSTMSVSSLTYLPPTAVADLLRDDSQSSKGAVIDVRDSDYIGGHIHGCQHVPIDQLDARLPELLRVNKDKEKVIFHCMLSQQRGPRAALMYARAKQAQEGKEKKNGTKSESLKQDVCVLEGGFGAWQSRYGEDKNLTEGYVKDLWEAEIH